MAVRLAYRISLVGDSILLEADSHGGGMFDSILFNKPDFKKEGKNLRIKGKEASILVKFGAGNDNDTETFNGETNVEDALDAIETLLTP